MNTQMNQRHATFPSLNLKPRRAFDLNDLVVRAAQGDRIAVAALAVTFGPILRNLAATVMEPYAQDADDVVQDFLSSLLGRQCHLVPGPDRAIAWMLGVVRAAARAYRVEREAEWEDGDERG